MARQLQKKLNPVDFELAAQSKICRIKELEELRDKKIKINGDNYGGQLLADVLEKDIMEIPPKQSAA